MNRSDRLDESLTGLAEAVGRLDGSLQTSELAEWFGRDAARELSQCLREMLEQLARLERRVAQLENQVRGLKR